jgi:hypothetical protein
MDTPMSAAQRSDIDRASSRAMNRRMSAANDHIVSAANKQDNIENERSE